VRVSEADNLAGIAGVGENFLVTSEAGIKNDFSAVARASARRAAFKYSSVFQREDRATCELLRQCVLPNWSSNRHRDAAFTVYEDVSEPKWSAGQYAKTALP
jgi:hypothetical protein